MSPVKNVTIVILFYKVKEVSSVSKRVDFWTVLELIRLWAFRDGLNALCIMSWSCYLRVRVKSIRRQEDLPWKRRYHLGAGVSGWLKGKGGSTRHRTPGSFSRLLKESDRSLHAPASSLPSKTDCAPDLFSAVAFFLLFCHSEVETAKNGSRIWSTTLQSLERDGEKVAGWSGCRWASVVQFGDTGSLQPWPAWNSLGRPD